MASTVLVGVALSGLTALVYALVGRRVAARHVRGDDRLANLMFAGWWWLLGSITGVGALINLAAAFGYTHVTGHVTLFVVLMMALSAALFALAFYLVYLFTGRRFTIYPLAVFYIVLFAYIMNLVWHAHPIAVVVGRWSAELVYERPLAPGLSSVWLLALLVAPQVIGGLAYFSLLFRVPGRSQRYRIALISGSILFWFGSAVVASAAGFAETPVWQVAGRLIALGAAAVVYYAFEPPGWVQRRFGIHPVAMVLVGAALLQPGPLPTSAPRAADG